MKNFLNFVAVSKILYMKFHIAPVQGHTDAPYRHFHNKIYNCESDSADAVTYYTPFIRLEGGKIRKKDIKDFTSPLNSGASNVPQIIFRDSEELTALISLMREYGVTRIDLNMGCPFPLQTGHGRGAATVANEKLARQVRDIINQNKDIRFSVKMRLGMSDPEEWKILLPYLNDTLLSHIAVHPRVARQQYSGSLHLNQFSEIIEKSVNPVVFNGEIKSPENVADLLSNLYTAAHPGKEVLSGIMIGRGLLSRPSLIREIIDGEEWSKEKRLETMLQFHRKLYDYYTSELCGDSQIIAKIQPFWEYAESEIGRKAWKAIKKAGNIAKYNSAVALIGG